MISNASQNWIVGHKFRVGFLPLKVRVALTASQATRNRMLTSLMNLQGNRLYKFVSHNGLQTITSKTRPRTSALKKRSRRLPTNRTRLPFRSIARSAEAER
jgi:hypothetical protein